MIEVNDRGDTIREWTSLVNPERDIGPTALHGLFAADCARAPTFEAIAGEIYDWLNGSIVIAHNVAFDRRFLEAEFGRLGASIAVSGTICTLQLARTTRISSAGRSLNSLCDALGIELSLAHSALDDTRAALAVLRQIACSRGAISLESLAQYVVTDVQSPPPALRRPSSPALSRIAAQERRRTEPSPIRRVIEAVPRDGSTFPEMDSYLEVLDRALLDRRLSPSECDELIHVAKSMGLNEATVIAAHQRYMADLIRQAWMDGVLTDLEQEDLVAVRSLLGISDQDYERMLALGRESSGSEKRIVGNASSQLTGRSVCFTGALVGTMKGQSITRNYAASLAEEHGMVVKASVSQNLDYLVTADPDSQSGKAKQARAYGVTILAESVFWSMMGVRVD